MEQSLLCGWVNKSHNVGIGNGISLIIFAGIVAELPRAVAGTLELGRQGTFNALEIIALFALVTGAIVLIVFMERAQRRIPCTISASSNG